MVADLRTIRSLGSGKSTLIREVAAEHPARLVDLDDEAALNVVRQDPTVALTDPGLVIVDEYQREPSVLTVVKRIVDREGGPGRTFDSFPFCSRPGR